jgi:hypothetical protein
MPSPIVGIANIGWLGTRPEFLFGWKVLLNKNTPFEGYSLIE